ncbi:MAG: hypothetical protein SD837_19220 [Candidatus Electrothrix scaldis]|nr:MAG: hypothetical protein SD837_19220 [Candidatus Electrothrix sp. GW3-3]
MITDRPPQQLPQAEPDEITGNGQLNHPGIRSQGPAHRWHGGQIEVGGDGPESHEQAQDAKDIPTSGHCRDDLGIRLHLFFF